MLFDDDLPSMILALTPDLLIFIAMLILAIVSLTQRRRLGPTATALAAAGFGLMALEALFQGLWLTFGIRYVIEEFRGNYTTVLTVVSLLQRLVFLVSLGLLAAAIFAKRPNAQAVPAPQPQQPVY